MPQNPSSPSQDPASEGPDTLSHVTGGSGGQRSRMVTVAGKPVTLREARARAMVEFPPGMLEGILADGGPKGPIMEVARVAGIGAAKQTSQLIPLCHPLGLDGVDLEIERHGTDTLEVQCWVVTTGRTGVEMEAMVGASVAALTLYDMTKALSKGIRIAGVELLSKSGGKSGTWTRQE